MLDYFIYEPDISEQLRNMQYITADQALGQYFQENCTIDSLGTAFNDIFSVHSITNAQSKTIETSPRKYLNIGAHLTLSQEEQLIALLNKYHIPFSWECTDMPEFIRKHVLTIFIQIIT